MANNQHIFILAQAGHHTLKSFDCATRCEFLTELNGRFVAKFGADQRSRLQRALSGLDTMRSILTRNAFR